MARRGKGVYIYLYANMAYDFFLDVLDRRGYDGNNGAMFLLYNYKGGLYENSNAGLISAAGEQRTSSPTSVSP